MRSAWIRFLIRAYPRSFRRLYGREMVQLFEGQRREQRYCGRFGGLRFGIDVVLDVALGACRVRLRRLIERAVPATSTMAPPAGREAGPRAAPMTLHLGSERNTMDNLLQDLRYSVRTLSRRPGWALAAVATLALGIGSTTAIFSVVHDVLVRPLPYDQPERLQLMRDQSETSHKVYGSSSFPTYDIYRQAQPVLESLEAFGGLTMTFNFEDQAQSLRGTVVTAGLFGALRVSPARGRSFVPEEDLAESAPVVILSHRLWQQRFGADPEIVGRRFRMEEEPYTIIGVMPADFVFPDLHTEYWLPMRIAPRPETTFYLRQLGRLKEGLSQEQAQARLETMRFDVPTGGPGETHRTGLVMTSLHEAVVGDVRPQLLVSLAAVASVLIIACINVVNLLLSRVVGRGREIALRSALGADRFRLVRQLVCESLLLSGAGSALGIGLAWALIQPLRALAGDAIPRPEELGLDATAVLFAVGLAILVGVAVGLLPALRATGSSPARGLGQGSRGAVGGVRHNRLRHGLIVSQLALTLVLLSCGLVLLESLGSLAATESGFTGQNMLMVETELPGARYQDLERRQLFYGAALERLAALPGVDSVTAASSHPFVYNSNQGFAAAGYTPAEGERLLAKSFFVETDYFRTVGAELISGRVLDARDGDRSMVINETLARRYFPSGDAIGGRIRLGSQEKQWREVVGVVGDVRQFSLGTDQKSVVYVPYSTDHWPHDMTLLIRSEIAPLELARAVREEIARIDSGVPIYRLRTIEDFLWSSLAAPRFRTVLLGAFALAALVLSVLGLYAVMGYWVGERTRELGVRMALGADRGRILWHVVGRGLGLTALGLGLGLLGSYPAVRLLEASLTGLASYGAGTFALALLALAVAGLLASYLPALRASRLDPLAALRSE